MPKTILYKEKLFKVYDLPDILSNDYKNGFIIRSKLFLSHFNKFIYALNRVDKDYYVFDLNHKITNELQKGNSSNKQMEALKQTERVFAYELYHQWSCNLCHSEGWVLNGESRKNIEYFCDQQPKGKQKGNLRNYPDMILHKGQSKDGQLIICEIKRKDRIKMDFVKDIKSLSLFVDPPNNNDDTLFKPFKCGIFLAFCSDFDYMITTIFDKWNTLKKNEIDKKCYDKIICVTSNCNEKNNDIDISFQSLGEILRQLKYYGFIQDKEIINKKTQSKTK